MKIQNSKNLGQVVRIVRRALGVTQDGLALTAGTNRRFVIELEKGKPTAQIGKALQVLSTLGIRVDLVPPPGVSLDNPVSPGDRSNGKKS